VKEGILILDTRKKQLDIRFSPREYYGGLESGDWLDVFLDGEWRPTRIQQDGSEWQLVGVDREISLVGLGVRK